MSSEYHPDDVSVSELERSSGKGGGASREGLLAEGWRIDRSGPYPLYYQLKQALLHSIHSQNLKSGDRLPTEGEIEARFGVSRTTIRQALSELVAEGFIERIQGKGTFVAAPKIQHVAMLTSFAENMRAQGYKPSRRVLESHKERASAEVAAVLEVAEGAQCWFLKRLLLADEQPVGLAYSWIPVNALKGHSNALEDLGRGSLYEFLQEAPLSLILHRGVETITAKVIADETTAALLRIPLGAAALQVNRITWLTGGRPVEWTKMTFAGDRYEYRVELVRPPS